jgi:hypothetical protein
MCCLGQAGKPQGTLQKVLERARKVEKSLERTGKI